MTRREDEALVGRHEVDTTGTKGGSPPKVPSTSDAVKALYAAFAGRRRPTRIDASPVVDARVVDDLVATPLAEIADETIGIYAGAALTTAGSVDDYRYFLPRILEQAVRRSVWFGTEPVVIAGKLSAAGWRSWTAAEIEAVETLFIAAWEQARASSPDDEDAGHWLLGLARLGTDLEAPLAGWLVSQRPDAIAQIASVLLSLRSALPRAEHHWADVAVETRRGLFDWSTSTLVETALIEGSGTVAEHHRWMIDAAVDAIAELKATGFR